METLQDIWKKVRQHAFLIVFTLAVVGIFFVAEQAWRQVPRNETYLLQQQLRHLVCALNIGWRFFEFFYGVAPIVGYGAVAASAAIVGYILEKIWIGGRLGKQLTLGILGIVALAMGLLMLSQEQRYERKGPVVCEEAITEETSVRATAYITLPQKREGNGFFIEVSHDGGQTWEHGLYSLHFGTTTNICFTIEGLNDAFFWVWGWNARSPTPTVLAKSLAVTADGGDKWHTWHMDPQYAGYSIIDVKFDNEQRGLMTIEDGQGDRITYITQDGGVTWQQT